VGGSLALLLNRLLADVGEIKTGLVCYAFKSLSALPARGKALQRGLWAQVYGPGGLPYTSASACLQRTIDLNNVYWFEGKESSTLGIQLNVLTDGGRHLRLPSSELSGDISHVCNHQYDALKSSPMSPLGKSGPTEFLRSNLLR
jgi:hypothetical protein